MADDGKTFPKLPSIRSLLNEEPAEAKKPVRNEHFPKPYGKPSLPTPSPSPPLVAPKPKRAYDSSKLEHKPLVFRKNFPGNCLDYFNDSFSVFVGVNHLFSQKWENEFGPKVHRLPYDVCYELFVFGILQERRDVVEHMYKRMEPIRITTTTIIEGISRVDCCHFNKHIMYLLKYVGACGNDFADKIWKELVVNDFRIWRASNAGQTSVAISLIMNTIKTLDGLVHPAITKRLKETPLWKVSQDMCEEQPQFKPFFERAFYDVNTVIK